MQLCCCIFDPTVTISHIAVYLYSMDLLCNSVVVYLLLKHLYRRQVGVVSAVGVVLALVIQVVQLVPLFGSMDGGVDGAHGAGGPGWSNTCYCTFCAHNIIPLLYGPLMQLCCCIFDPIVTVSHIAVYLYSMDLLCMPILVDSVGSKTFW